MTPRNLHRRIADAFGSHLMQAPHQYGAPLRKTLIGYWKIRVGDYRAVYKIDEQEMLILGIRHRKSVYEDILQRVSPIRALLSHPSDTASVAQPLRASPFSPPTSHYGEPFVF
jgi:mRNA-degrading endonuclease RelE of RelBE toxin-antitoxin system